MEKYTSVNVLPSNKLFKRLSYNTYNYLDLLSELIDNALAAKYPGKIVNIIITIEYSKENNRAITFTIEDDAQGIPLSNLAKTISPAALAGNKKNSLAEHGMGLKQSSSALGELVYLISKTKESDYEFCIDEFKFGEIKVKKNYDIDYESGTTIKIKNLSPIVSTSKRSYTTKIVPRLGARYRRFLNPKDRKANITINLIEIDGKEEPEVWDVVAIKPIYFNKSTMENRPTKCKTFSGDNGEWEARFIFGYAPTDEQYIKLNLEKPLQYDPYNVSLSKQGFDILMNDRVISFSQFPELGFADSRHPSKNHIRGEIDLIKGFNTAITKNSVIRDQNFLDLIKKIKDYMMKHKLLKEKSKEELPEKLINERLRNHLKVFSQVLMDGEKVQSEYPIEALGGRVDVLVRDTPWEIKPDSASGLCIYELFAYMDMGGFKEGFFLAESFTTGAESAANFINANHDKKITLITLSELGIDYPKTKDEEKRFN